MGSSQYNLLMRLLGKKCGLALEKGRASSEGGMKAMHWCCAVPSSSATGRTKVARVVAEKHAHTRAARGRWKFGVVWGERGLVTVRRPKRTHTRVFGLSSYALTSSRCKQQARRWLLGVVVV